MWALSVQAENQEEINAVLGNLNVSATDALRSSAYRRMR